jgi:hypothetical protein
MNITMTVAASHATGLQRREGGLPVGNSSNRKVPGNITAGTQLQPLIQATNRPPGRELELAMRAYWPYSLAKRLSDELKAMAAKSQPMALLGLRLEIRNPTAANAA